MENKVDVWIVCYESEGVKHVVEKAMTEVVADKRVEMHERCGERAWKQRRQLTVNPSDFPSLN